MNKKKQLGSAEPLLIATISLSVFGLLAAIAALWGIMNYLEQKTNVDGKVTQAVTKAKKDQVDTDEAKFMAREKDPNRQFVGPDDYGRLSFDYPKTWSVYVAKDASRGGDYEAYLNPVTVPTVSSTQQYALRVTIQETDYDKVVASYSSAVKKGDLVSSAVSADGNDGTRLDGTFSKDIRGAAVLYKVRDKTITLRTDADTFKTDFEKLIKTIKFNQ